MSLSVIVVVQGSCHELINASFTLQFSRALVHNVLKAHLGDDIPTINEFGRNLSFALQNGHFSVSNSRPYLPSIAEIGCIHCQPAKPLPKVRIGTEAIAPEDGFGIERAKSWCYSLQYLEDFIRGAGDVGFVFVSMGTSVNTEKMPPHLLRTLVDAFAKLAPYRVLWKFEGNLGDDLPPNVKIERWLPQQDILGESVFFVERFRWMWKINKECVNCSF